MEQIQRLIEMSENSPIHMQVLFNVLMGHAKEIITMDVYGDNANIIPEEIPELLAYMDDVLPGRAGSDQKEEEIEDIMIDVDEFLPLG